MSDYPKRRSKVEVTFNDGVVQSYDISAGAGIAQYLARETGETGILSLLDGDKAYAIPVANIREWFVVEVDT